MSSEPRDGLASGQILANTVPTLSALKVDLGREKEQGRIVLKLPQKIVSFNM